VQQQQQQQQQRVDLPRGACSGGEFNHRIPPARERPPR
jgi:hypothetical protein